MKQQQFVQNANRLSLKNKIKFQTASSISILLAVLICIGCESNKPEEIKAISNLEDTPSLIIKKLETTICDSGLIKYKFISNELLQYDKKQKPYIDFPQGLHVIIYNNKEQIDAQIKCNYAIYQQSEKLWELKNDVEAVNFKGEVLNTEQLFWDEQKHKVYSDLFVKITTPNEILTGIGFESNENLSKYLFRKPQGEFEVENSNPSASTQ